MILAQKNDLNQQNLRDVTPLNNAINYMFKSPWEAYNKVSMM